MATEKQIAANRLNALKSTGPKTPETKAKSRLNAQRDGLTGQVTTLSDEERPIFEKLKADHIAALNPDGLQQLKIAHSIAWDTWRLDHLRAIEMNVYAQAAEEEAAKEEAANENTASDANPANSDELDAAISDARTFRAEAKRFELMSLYEQRMNRSLHRNMVLLRELQAERKRHREEDKKEEVIIARLHEYNEMPIKASTRPSRNGFIFSDEEIAIAAARQRYVDVAVSTMKTTFKGNLGGGLDLGRGDEFLRKIGPDEIFPLSPERRQELNSIPLEIAVIDRLKNPADFGLHTQ
jgi:hypothetical protein